MRLLGKSTLGRQFIQEKLSPIKTRLFALKWQHRKRVASIIRFLATTFKEQGNEDAYIALEMALSNRGYTTQAWIRSRFRPSILLKRAEREEVALEAIQHYHVKGTVRLKELLAVIEKVFRESGLVSEEEGSGLYRRIVFDVAVGRGDAPEVMVPEAPSTKQLLDTIRFRVLRDLEADESRGTEWQPEIIGQAFDFACEVCGLEEKKALYIIEKIAGIGGDVFSMIASLLMYVPALELRDKFESIAHVSEYEELYTLREPLCGVIGVFEYIRDHFVFEAAKMRTDEMYLWEKMSELARSAQASQNLLVFFLHALEEEAREAQTPQAAIFDRIRFLYAPLAEKLGLIFLADDFRDQFLRLAYPEERREIIAQVLKRIGMFSYKAAKIFLNMYARQVLTFLERNGLDTREIVIKFRVKSPFSVWNKLRWRKKYSIDRIHDILGIKIICPVSKDNKTLLRIAKFLEGKNSPFISNAKRKKMVLGASDVRVVKKGAFAEAFEEEKIEQIWQFLVEQQYITERGELLVELKDDPSTLKLEAPFIGPADKTIVFDILKQAQEIVWRGIKLEGHDANGKPIEIQIMDEAMNEENTSGKAAAWFYNLLKELGDIRCPFVKKEPIGVVPRGYVAKFEAFVRWWSIRPRGR